MTDWREYGRNSGAILENAKSVVEGGHLSGSPDIVRQLHERSSYHSGLSLHPLPSLQILSGYISTEAREIAVTFPNPPHLCVYFFCNKCNITIINVSIFFGKSGELIKNTARCCQPQV